MKNDLFLKRLLRYKTSLPKDEIWLLTDKAHIHYLTGYNLALLPQHREVFLILTKKHNYLKVPPMGPIKNASWLETSYGCRPKQLSELIKQLTKDEGVTTLRFNPNQLTTLEYNQLRKDIPELKLKFIDHKKLWQMRLKKDIYEQSLLKKSARIATQVVTNITQNLKAGQTEKELANLIDFQLAQAGANPAFPTIVAFGAHTALPHHQPTTFKLKPNTPVLIDMGASCKGYKSDLTRSFWFGKKPKADFMRHLKVVKTAYQAGLNQLKKAQKDKTPLTAAKLDQVVRGVIENKRLGKRFIHTTGHGVGLEIHEPPSISSRGQTPLTSQMTITIEPGIYFPGRYGLRFENTVLIKEKGVKELTKNNLPDVIY